MSSDQDVTENANQSKTDDYQLEGYKNLSDWNERDEQSMNASDRLLIPASVGVSVYALTQETVPYEAVYGGSVLVLIYWLLLSLRCKAWLKRRFETMKEIEIDLGFKAHSRIKHSDMKVPLSCNLIPLGWIRDIRVRLGFFVSFLLLFGFGFSEKPLGDLIRNICSIF